VQQQVPDGYKQTEVGVIPEDWKLLTIDDLTTIVGDGIHATPVYSLSGEYYFINGNNIDKGSITVTGDTKRVDLAEYHKHKKDLSNRTIFLSINGTIGNLAFYNKEQIVLGKSAAYFNIKEGFSKIYIYYCLQSNAVKKYFDDGLTGTTIKNLGLGVIRSTPVPIPSTDKEQTAIANALSDVDTLITSLEKLIVKKRAIKTAAMQQLLSGKKRLPPFDETHTGYKQTALGEIPEDWEVEILDDLSIISRLAGAEYTSMWKETVDGEIIALRGFNIGKNKLIERELTHISNELSVKLKRSRLVAGDVVYPCVGTIGNAAVIEESNKYHIQQNIARITPVVSKLSPYFLSHYLMSELAMKEVERFTATTSQPSVLVGSLRQYRIPLPYLKDEQIAIANVLTDMDKDVEALENRLNKTQQLKQGMMQELLTGRTRLV